MSEEIGVAKPDLAFFERCLALMGHPDPANVSRTSAIGSTTTSFPRRRRGCARSGSAGAVGRHRRAAVRGRGGRSAGGRQPEGAGRADRRGLGLARPSGILASGPCHRPRQRRDPRRYPGSQVETALGAVSCAVFGGWRGGLDDGRRDGALRAAGGGGQPAGGPHPARRDPAVQRGPRGAWPRGGRAAPAGAGCRRPGPDPGGPAAGARLRGCLPHRHPDPGAHVPGCAAPRGAGGPDHCRTGGRGAQPGDRPRLRPELPGRHHAGRDRSRGDPGGRRQDRHSATAHHPARGGEPVQRRHRCRHLRHRAGGSDRRRPARPHGVGARWLRCSSPAPSAGSWASWPPGSWPVSPTTLSR